jgi:hypothetical protein
MTAQLDGALVQARDGFKVIELVGEPYERGRQHGTALRSEVRFFRDSLYRDLLFKRGRTMGAAFTAVVYGLAARMHPHISRELREEMRGVADGAGVSYRDVLLFNCFDDVLHGLMQINPVLAPLMNHRFVAPILGLRGMACSSFVVAPERARDGRPIHGRNLDYFLNDGFLDPDGLVPKILRENVVVFVVRPDRGRPFASVAWPGYVGVVTALNADGVSLACLTSTVARETPNGVPLPLLYRLIAQYAGSLEEVEWLLRGARRTIGNNLTVASGMEGDARLFEFTPDRLAAIRPRDGMVTATNHFQDPRLAEAQVGWVFPNSEYRLARLRELFDAGRFDVGDAQAALLDACPVDGAQEQWDCLQNPGTVYSTIAEPARLTLWVRANDVADRPFVELDLAEQLGAAGLSTAA